MSSTFPYLKPPKLVRGSWKWMIEWEEFVPGTTTKVRVRKTYDLNRAYFISNPALRESRAQEILAEKQNEYSAPAQKQHVIALLGSTQIYEAVHVALRVKCATDREHTRITYTSFTNIFCEWLKEMGWLEMPVTAFDRSKAKAFLDWVLLERKTRKGAAVGGRTYNNYIINLRSLFYELVNREYIAVNPFANHPKRKEEQKLRHAFTQEDSDIIADYVYRHNRPVYLAILLISHCGMRLSELRRLRARDIDLERGLIVMGGDQTKNRERAFITIPTVALDTLRAFDLHKIPGQHLIFGIEFRPHPRKAVGRNTISDRFREMLRAMVDKGILSSAEGYTAYSWKDTGAMAMVRSGMDILAIQKHLRHKSLDTTQRYLQSLGIINRDVRDFKGLIFRLPHEIPAAA
ncbi:MAG TPA: tyrosine-type recombinase/integrase [Saprospiraceae bacterium]|nr:tyrosine-type recombinase/integrase [Saprospiraceae bacterium]